MKCNIPFGDVTPLESPPASHDADCIVNSTTTLSKGVQHDFSGHVMPLALVLASHMLLALSMLPLHSHR